MLLDPGKDSDEIRRAVRHGLVHAAGIAWADGGVLIDLAGRTRAAPEFPRGKSAPGAKARSYYELTTILRPANWCDNATALLKL
jgi:hypothetical protein